MRVGRGAARRRHLRRVLAPTLTLLSISLGTGAGCELIGGITEKPLADCTPGDHRCKDSGRETCNDEGSGYVVDVCPAQQPFCVESGRCVECVTDPADPTPGDCHVLICNDGQVERVNDDEDVAQVVDDCKHALCSGGTPLTIPDATDRLDDGDPCTIEACSNGEPVVTTPPPGTVCELARGHADANLCVRRAGGALSCTGDNSWGQLALGATDGDPHPSATGIPVPPVRGATVGGASVFAWTASGDLYGWGRNDEGQVLPNGPATLVDPTALALVVEGEPLAVCGVAAHRHHTCARSCDGRVACWGSNLEGELGNGGLGAQSGPTFVLDPSDVGGVLRNVLAVDVGEHHGCALRGDGTLRCWGRAPLTGTGRAPGSPPASVSLEVPLTNLDSLALGGANACAHKREGSIYCWGDDSAGQITEIGGPGATSPVPLPAIDFLGFGGVGDRSVCVIEPTRVACWGADEIGQLGVDDGCAMDCTTFFHDPVSPAGLGLVKQLVVHAGFACALGGGAVRCWGDNAAGQLGTTSAAWFEQPIDVGL